MYLNRDGQVFNGSNYDLTLTWDVFKCVLGGTVADKFIGFNINMRCI